MSKVISVNAGSSSLKFQLFNMPEEEVICSGAFERIGLEQGIFTIKVNGEKHVINEPFPTHDEAVQTLLKALVDYKVVESLEEIKGAGHRIVQGGAYFSGSAVVNEDSTAKVMELAELAPLHNKSEVGCCQAFQKALPHCGNIYVFDTAFHQTMGAESYMYAVPYEWYTDYKVRRYGAHGTSHMYVSKRTAELMGKNVEDLKIITCHLGNGASITAVDGGKCVNTSMGFTPLGGIMMGTRCGDIDPAIVPYMMKKTGMTPDEMDTALNKKSGMLGISGVSSDARDVEDAVAAGNERAILTQAIYVNRVINVIGGYYMQMGGVDAIAFTAGLGENDCNLRHQICEALEAGLGLKMNYEVNDCTRGKEMKISAEGSKVDAWIVPTNEELMIARDVVALLGYKMFEAILDKIREFDTITIYPHTSADGDALGSCFGLKELLVHQFPEKHIYVLGEEGGKRWEFFPEFDVVSDEVVATSLAMSLDTGNTERIGDQRYKMAKYLIKIDHHPNVEPFGDMMVVDDQKGATCELITVLGRELVGEEFPPLAARYLYAGLTTDTMGFTTSSTNEHSLMTAAFLSRFGINHNEINYLLTAKEIPLFRYISKIRDMAVFEGEMLYVIVPKTLYKEYGISYENARNLVSSFAGIKGIKIWTLFTESDDFETSGVKYSVSLRSRGVVINDVAADFHGGGHTVAAGAKLMSEEELSLILDALRSKLN